MDVTRIMGWSECPKNHKFLSFDYSNQKLCGHRTYIHTYDEYLFKDGVYFEILKSGLSTMMIGLILIS